MCNIRSLSVLGQVFRIVVSLIFLLSFSASRATAESPESINPLKSEKVINVKDYFGEKSTNKPVESKGNSASKETSPKTKNSAKGEVVEQEVAGKEQEKSVKKAEEVSTPDKKTHVFVSSDPTAHLLAPDADFPIRINPEAPGPFIGMATALEDGDRETAAQYADAYVRYMTNLMIRVSEITNLIGEAMVRQGVIDEESWVGVGQFINKQFAAAREKNGSMWKMTHERALERVKPDPNGQAEIYFFTTLNCKWCRDMGPDVERLWQVVKRDPNLRMVTLTPQRYPQAWVDSFKDFTGMTGPVLYGANVAKALRVGFVPALVVVSPGNKTSYVKTGKQSFKHMYEFVRKVQGLPLEMSEEVKKEIAGRPIGREEIAKANGKSLFWEEDRQGDPSRVLAKTSSEKKSGVESVDRF
ncbi:MAG: hypothetical protein IT291_02120 [Deltaproteobacteria bacterium]|nr:hypothetical protein [Deltaproteobacteria bacterium]